MPERWEIIKGLFEDAAELDRAERATYLLKSGHDAEVCAEVERLLAERDEAGSFLSSPVFAQIDPGNESRRFSPGEIIGGRFEIICFIAAGGMGEVYEADDRELRERVAIKTISSQLLQPKAISRLRREVKLARRVTHPNVCRIFDLFRNVARNSQEQDTLFVSMELLHGRTMAQRLREDGPLDLLAAAPVIRQLADGLNTAHEAGVIHGDLKPGNIFLVNPKRPHGEIRVVITDFGLAVPALDFVESSRTTLSTLTTAGIRGTPAYMAPEQLRGGRATVASDLYAFGVIVCELVTGVHPFAEENVSLQMDAILNGRPRTPSSLKQTLPKSFDAIMLKALENNPINRYRSAAEFIEKLEPVLVDSHSGGQTACSRSNLAGVQPADAPASLHAERLHWLQPRTGWTLAIGTLVIVTLLLMLLGFAAYYKLDL